MSEAFVYKWNRTNGEYYIGVHKGSQNDYYVGSGKLFKDKYQNFKDQWSREILFEGTREDCFEIEELIVDEERLNDPLCLNLSLGGNGGDRGPQVNKKRAETLKGVTPWNKGKKGVQAGSFGMAGKKHSEETKRKMSESMKAKKDLQRAARGGSQ